MSWTPVRRVAPTLKAHHYLGPTHRGIAWEDEYGCLVLAAPTSRHLPGHWLELVRWCLVGTPIGGSRQWARVRRAIAKGMPYCTTVVSYSDPSAGHTGALYRACNWEWAPTWHRLRPPPSGNGDWGSGAQAVKDRWVYAVRADPCRDYVLSVKDAAAERSARERAA